MIYVSYLFQDVEAAVASEDEVVVAAEEDSEVNIGRFISPFRILGIF